MVNINFVVVALAALIPLIIGALWYNPRVFGNMWIKASGITEDQIKSGKMPLIFGLTYVASFLIAIQLCTIVIHQFGAQSMLIPDVMNEGTDAYRLGGELMEKFGGSYRTFKHGAFHGTITGLFTALPIITIISLFERKSGKYIFVHAGYFVITLALMGGVLCQFV